MISGSSAIARPARPDDACSFFFLTVRGLDYLSGRTIRAHPSQPFTTGHALAIRPAEESAGRVRRFDRRCARGSQTVGRTLTAKIDLERLTRRVRVDPGERELRTVGAVVPSPMTPWSCGAVWRAAPRFRRREFSDRLSPPDRAERLGKPEQPR